MIESRIKSKHKMQFSYNRSMEIYTKQNIINYTSDPDEANDFKYDRKLQEARKALREDDLEAKRTGGVVDWDYLLSRVDS